MAATRQIRPPPLRQHLAELKERRDAWWIIARNLIPLVGVYALGWSGPLAVFSYWVDGVLGLAAIIALMLPRAMRESAGATDLRTPSGIVGLVFAWLLLVGIVGLPYWIVLIPLAGIGVLRPAWEALLGTPSLWVAYAGMGIGRYLAARKRRYDALPDAELKQALRWDVYLLLLRAIAMFLLMAHGFFLVVVLPLMTVVMSYLEIWPERALGAVWGDPTRLHEDRGSAAAPLPDARRRRKRGGA